jgi:hypothetical protein
VREVLAVVDRRCSGLPISPAEKRRVLQMSHLHMKGENTKDQSLQWAMRHSLDHMSTGHVQNKM